MKAFFDSHAGRASVGVILAVISLLSPLASSWMVAAFTLTYAVRHFRDSFRELDAAPAETPQPIDQPPSETAGARSAGSDGGELNVDAIVATLATQETEPAPVFRGNGTHVPSQDQGNHITHKRGLRR